MGDALATDEEKNINCTSTQGSFTQEPAKYYIQYSAPTAGGASGSPVFNTIAEGDKVVLGNQRGEVRIHAKLFDGVRRGVLIAESIWPNHAYEGGCGINTLTGADPIAPFGGAAFHDNRVWIKPAG